jgi:hypothetical protein
MRKLSIFLQVLFALPLVAAGIALRENASSFSVLGQVLLVVLLFGGIVALFVTSPKLRSYWFLRVGWQVAQTVAPDTGGASDGQRRAGAGRAAPGGEASGPAKGASPAAGGGSSAGGGGGRGGGGGTGNGYGDGDDGSGMPPEDGLPDDIRPLINAYLARGEFPPMTLVADLDDLARYVVQNPDQELWLQLVYNLNYDLPASHDCFMAMVQHPACENAVAAGLLDQMWAEAFFEIPADRARDLDPNAFDLIRLICERDAAQGFSSTGVGDSPYLDRDELRNRLARIRTDPDTPLRVPNRLLLETPSGRPPRTRYSVDETGVYRLA